MKTLTDTPATERRLDLSGVTTPYLEAGDGPPVVLLHGPGGDASHWNPAIARLAPTYHLIAPDLPGLGESTLAAPPPTPQLVIDWLGALIDETCDEPPALVGNALGGSIAARFAIEHPDAAARLVLIDTFGLGPFEPSPEFGRALNEFIAEPTRETHDRLWRYCAHDIARLRSRMGAEWEAFAGYNVERAQTPAVQVALGALMGDFGLPAIPPAELERITPPTALIWGRHDLAIPLTLAREASARYGWPLTVIEDCADDPPIEQPDAFAEAVLALIPQGAVR